MNVQTDIVIPLGGGSRNGNDELRLALRSIAKYGTNIGRIWIAGTKIPEWVCNVSVLPIPDSHRRNKDANLLDKLLAAANEPAVSERFLWWSDDQLALAPFDAAKLPPIANPRGPGAFHPEKRWQRRMLHTFALLQEYGISLSYNWDAHIPRPMEKSKVRTVLQGIDYTVDPGYCLTTLIYGLLGIRPEHWQRDWKVSVEGETLPVLNRPWVGYNDTGFAAGLRTELFVNFPEPSCYELKAPPEWTLLTPTGDREPLFALTVRSIAEQRRQAECWRITDDGREPLPNAFLAALPLPYVYYRLVPQDRNTLASNAAFLAKTVTDGKAAWIEDDDYYPPGYLARLAETLTGADLAGASHRHQYRFFPNAFRHYRSTGFACLHASGFTAAVASEVARIAAAENALREKPAYAVDIRLWTLLDCRKKMADFGEDTPVSIKNTGIGRAGCTPAHRTGRRFREDADGRVFRKWFQTAADRYQAFRGDKSLDGTAKSPDGQIFDGSRKRPNR